jgi:response regulator RpfG family c-di-GMP phosphodiesterase
MSNEHSHAEDDWLIDDSVEPSVARPEPPWRLLIVDDEPDVHRVTRLALRGIEYKGRSLELLSAYSGQEGFELLRDQPGIALTLLDVVMETDDAGLRLVQRVREELDNLLVRIVLRTGQPGQAPEQEVILSYDINDYKAKTELTLQKLYTTVIASLRAYESLVAIERSRQGLSKILEGSANLYQMHSLREFASGVLAQIGAILDVGTHGILCVRRGVGSDSVALQVLGATGSFAEMAHHDELDEGHPVYPLMLQAIENRQSLYAYPNEVLYIPTQTRHEFLLYFTPPWPLTEVDKDLLEVFCSRIASAFDNLHHHLQMARAQEATVVALADLAEYRDSDTGDHVLRVEHWTARTARRMAERGDYPDELTPRFLELIGMASILHDVGKVATPDLVLFKPGVHDQEQREVMRRHASIGAAILQRSARMVEGQSYLSIGAEIAGGHHEHFDGQGYPQALKGEQIPLSARIVAVVDVFDALMHRRPYKEPWSLADSLAYIRERSGKQFDPKVVAAFLDEVDEEYSESQDSA